MQENSSLPKEPHYLSKAVDIALRLVIVAILLSWCFQIIKPFIDAILWGIILAVALYPLYDLIKRKTKLSNKAVAIIITLLMLAILIVPSYLLMETLIEDAQLVAHHLSKEDLTIPVPPENVRDWPLIGKPLHTAWFSASQNLEAFLEQYSSQIQQAASWLLGLLVNLGMGIVQFIFATLISGILLANAESAAELAHKLFVRLAGKSGEEFSSISVRTIRNVIKGVIGVAVIQATLAGGSFFVVDIPGAGLWALACLLFCIVQIGLFPVAVPVIIYAFSTMDTVPAVLLCVWLVLVSLSDNILKPLLLGKGAPVPMPIIFIGVIGGFIATGFSGMFVGAIVFSIAYKVFLAWLHVDTPEDAAASEELSGKTTL